MTYIEWHQYVCVWGMRMARNRSSYCWSDLEEFNEMLLRQRWTEENLVDTYREYGLRATVTLQNEDDERRVRLLKDGQHEHGLSQCFTCRHIEDDGDPEGGWICCEGQKFEEVAKPELSPCDITRIGTS
jgi:hypothetical protein